MKLKKILFLMIFLCVVHLSFAPGFQTAVYDFVNLSATSRPIELRYMKGTGSQVGLLAGLYNHDNVPHKVRVHRGTYLKSGSGYEQSMMIAEHQACHNQNWFDVSSVFADNWVSQSSKREYIFEIPPGKLTEISLNAVCVELDKNPPSGSNYTFTLDTSAHSENLRKIFAAVDSINLKLVPEIKTAIVSENGGRLTLNRQLTHTEQVILINLESFPQRTEEIEQKYISFNTLNWAIWAVTDNLSAQQMAKKMAEWSGGQVDSYSLSYQREMVRMILAMAGLEKHAARF